jgi:hypothetical protein
LRIDLHLSPVFQQQFRLLEQRFNLLFEDNDAFLTVARAGAAFKRASHIEEKIALLAKGFFSEEILQFLISGGEGYKTGPVAYIWQRLVEGQVIVPTLGFEPNAFVNSTLMTDSLRTLLVTGTFQNLFYPPSNLLERYRSAIVKIEVEADGAPSTGTGFVVRDHEDNSDILLTAKHNVDSTEGISLKRVATEAGVDLPTGPFTLDPNQDIASMRLAHQVDGPAFHLTSHIAVFDELFTVGYPMLPLAVSSLVGHRGELNGYSTYYQTGHPLMIVSNLVSPGSSGCPILQRLGFAAGMTTRWLEAEYGEDRVRFSAGIPAQALVDHLNSHHG